MKVKKKKFSLAGLNMTFIPKKWKKFFKKLNNE